MTVTTSTARNQYIGTGTTGPFPYSYRILAATDLVVTRRSSTTLVELTLNYPADYSVSGVGNTGGGSVTLTTALATGDILTIRRVRPITQTTSIRNAGSYFPETHEDVFDKGIMIDQQLQDQLGSTFKLPSTLNPSSFVMTLPTPVAGQVLIWSSNGLTNGTVSTSSVVLPGEGRTTGTFTEYLANNYIYNVIDYDADPTGTIDSTASIQAAITAANPNLSRGGVVYFPPGVYNISNLTLPAYSVLLAPSWQLALLRAIAGTTGYMVWDQDINATGIRITGLGLDGNNQNVAGIRLGYHDPGAGSFNYGALLRDVRVQRCLGGYAFDIQANVGELEDCWASHGNKNGFRLVGIDVRGHRLACEDSTTTEMEIGAQGATIEKLHIETSIDKPIKFLAAAKGSQIKGVSLSIDVPATTITTLVEFDAASTWNNVQDLSINLDQAGSDYTNVVSDLNWPRTVLGTSLTNKRQAGSYYQDGYDLDVRLRSMRGTYASPSALAAGNNNNYVTAENVTLRLTPDAGGSTITGLAGGIGGRRLRLMVVNGGTLTLAHASGSSTAANQILSSTGANVTVALDQVADLEYDAVTQRWRICGKF